jgi:hypothetical protein
LLHLNAVLNWIEGKYSNGTTAGKPFNLFGSTFQVWKPRAPAATSGCMGRACRAARTAC